MSGLSITRTAYQLAFQISPIFLVGGIAALIPGGVLPIVALTQAADFELGLLNGSVNTDLDQFLCHWRPLPGTTLVANQVSLNPFANQAVAADAVIAQPLNVSMLMDCPAQLEGGYAGKLATLTVLQTALTMHNASGGTYTVLTPAGFYTNCLLTLVRDVSGGDSKQPQHTWQFDFLQPLLSLNQAGQVYNSLMSKIAGGLQTPQIPVWTGGTQLGGLQSFGAVPPFASPAAPSQFSIS
jgi:hypothetical protein